MKTISLAIVSLTLGTLSLSAADYPQWDGMETVASYAQRAGLEPLLTLDLGDGVHWEGVLIPAGSFVMGSPAGEAKTAEESAMEKQHKVTLTQPFYLGKFEITQAQYQKVMGDNPSLIKGDNLPLHNVVWQSAQDFCDKLSQRLKRTVQAPTEAQWEYACRAGTTTTYPSGSTIADLDKVGWYGANADRKPHPGGEKQPNSWGVYDMLGNIREYTQDLYSKEPFADATDPTGPKEGDPKNHVVRGGAYTANASVALNCRSAARRPTEAPAMTGFRIAVGVQKP